jgi:hypothetical protein
MKVGFKRDAVSKCSDMRRARLEDLHSSRHSFRNQGDGFGRKLV